MARDKKFLISTSENGIFRVGIEGQPSKALNLRKVSPEGKFEVLKAEILKMGVYFSPKIEKLVKKKVGYPKKGPNLPKNIFQRIRMR